MAIDATLVGTKGSANGTLTTGGGATTTGSTFVIALNYDAGATLSTALSALDNKGNTYVQIGSTQSVSGAKRALYYCANGAGGSGHVASAAFSASSFGTIYLAEITGAEAAPLDVNTAGTDATSPFTLASGTLAQADELILALVGNGEGANPMGYASSNMTELGQEGNGAAFWSSAFFKAAVASTTSFVASFTSNGGNNTHGMMLASFKQASVGGGGSSIAAISNYYRMMRGA